MSTQCCLVRHSWHTPYGFGLIFALLAICIGVVAAGADKEPLPRADAMRMNQPLGQSTTSQTSPRTIDVRGDGEAHTPPDTMFISIGVETRCGREDECFKTVAARADDVAAAVKAKFGAGAEISKTNIGVSPIYGSPSPTPTPTPAVLGWKFSETIKASTDSIELTGALIDAGIAAGAANVAGSGFDFQGPQPEYAAGMFLSPQGGTTTRRKEEPHLRLPFVMLSVEAEGKTADECVKRGSEVAKRVRRVLADKLGSHGTVQMEQYDVQKNQPQYAYRPPASQVQQGFSASTTVEIESRELDKLASIVEAAATAGAARINQVRYTLSNQSDARKEAIEQACVDARQKAEAAAHSLGVKLGKVSRINVDANVQTGAIYGVFAFAGASSASRSEFARQSVPHTPADVNANVSVTYLIE
jgi:uncharacterized protein YggE